MWEAEKQKKNIAHRSLLIPLLKTVGFWKFCAAIAVNAFTKVINYIPVLILGQLVQHFSGNFKFLFS
jgi:hypothetical protein